MIAPVGMPKTLVDSSVLLDVLTDDPTWATWSAAALSDAADGGGVVINPIVYAEVSIGFERIEDLDDAVPASEVSREPLPWEAGFVAGKPADPGRRPIPDLPPLDRGGGALTDDPGPPAAPTGRTRGPG
ncbi:MAG: PIN domain-containing protein [Pseudonocardia sp.]|nr:PIN domain-containing protein [Pseudonocardia sp.]